ncbi:MAG: HAMP domain-containing histidine kinase [Ideonella sp.]|nr:HAMP domain-containing histidine kinase [Ideonella sp.]
MISQDTNALVALKFELAMVVGESLELAPMCRRFLITLLNATGGRSAQLWIREPNASAEAGTQSERFAYPQRSLIILAADPDLHSWMSATAADPPGANRQWSNGARHVHALPVDRAGWLFIEPDAATLPEAVLEAISVVLMRLARACMACHEHARARRLLAAKEEAEAEVRHALLRKREVLALSGDGFATSDRRGELLFASERVSELVHQGMAPLAGLGDIDAALQKAGAGPTNLHALAMSLAPGESRQGGVVLHRPRHRDLQWTLRCTDDGGRVVLFLRDITRETELDRMKSRFLATAAHELRTPLASVLGYSELMLRRVDAPPERRRQMVEVVHRQAGLLVQLVNQLLDLAKLEASDGAAVRIKPTPLHKVLAMATEAFGVRDDGRAPTVVVGDPEEHLAVDPDAFVRVLVNLLSNAHKYSPGGGPIELTAKVEGHKGQRTAIVTVRDHGIGMTADQCSRVFERFYRADPSCHIPGSGLGMSIVKQIIDLHGGSIEVESQPDLGTTVITRWPLAIVLEPAPA